MIHETLEIPPYSSFQLGVSIFRLSEWGKCGMSEECTSTSSATGGNLFFALENVKQGKVVAVDLDEYVKLLGMTQS